MDDGRKREKFDKLMEDVPIITTDELVEMLSDEDVEIMTPQFDRTLGQPIPASFNSFDKIDGMGRTALKEMGCCEWDEGGLLLFPAEWYDEIPDGFIVTDINYTEEPFKRGETDDDRRFGMLSYGVVRKEE